MAQNNLNVLSIIVAVVVVAFLASFVTINMTRNMTGNVVKSDCSTSPVIKIAKGESNSYKNPAGNVYITSIDFIEARQVKLLINGKTTDKLGIGDSYQIDDTTKVRISSLYFLSKSGGVSSIKIVYTYCKPKASSGVTYQGVLDMLGKCKVQNTMGTNGDPDTCIERCTHFWNSATQSEEKLNCVYAEGMISNESMHTYVEATSFIVSCSDSLAGLRANPHPDLGGVWAELSCLCCSA